MGAYIDIRLENDKFDKRNITPFIGRDFVTEISHGHLWAKRKPFLSEKETEILYAPYYEIFEEEDLKLISPIELKKIINKVINYLKKNTDTLPFEIKIDYEKMDKENLNTDIIINNSRCWIKGDSFYHKIDDRVNIVNYPYEPNSVDIWISIAKKVVIENKTYYLKKKSRYEEFKKELNDIILFCELAINENQKIYWLFSH